MRTPKRTSSGERAKGPIVLLVEDVADVRTVLAGVLVREGFGVVEANNGHEAIVYASALTIDAIVMDLSLPLLDGVAAARVLRAHDRTRRIPVIALTGYPVEGADWPEFEHVLTKPCLPEVLVQRLRAVLARRGGGRSKQH
jgi:two-component system phosphate regulon response regulator PhoB